MNIKLLHLSDTHGQHHSFTEAINQQKADMIVFSGDFSNYSLPAETEVFLNWFRSLEVPHKILIAGNHDETFTEVSDVNKQYDLTDITYLENSGIEIMGLKIYGTPAVEMEFPGAFCYLEEEAKPFWEAIPLETNLLITHQPPKDILDQGKNQKSLGSVELLNKVNQLPNLKANLFGHIHESCGLVEKEGIQFSNASCCLNVLNLSYR